MSYLGDCGRCGSPVSTKDPGYDPADYSSDSSGRIWHRRGRCRQPVPHSTGTGRSYADGSRQAAAREILHAAWGIPEDIPVTELRTLETLAQIARTPALRGRASPIEQRFWDAHGRLGLPELDGLVFQHPAGRYRIDFALPDRKTGIELDGHATHSSTTAIAKDRQRQRDLERAGWRIIRFGGQEVHRDAAECVRQAAILIRQYTREGVR